jgi:uncharacterized membrane protein YbhN (UPF0104 family)
VAIRSKHRTEEPDPGSPDQEGLPRDRPRSVLRRIVGGALSYGVILVVFWSLLGKLREAQTAGLELAPITAAQVLVVTVLGLVNTCTNLPPIMLTLPGLRFREAFVTNTASSALSNTVPEGGAVATGLNFAMLRSWGFTLDRITSSYLTTGIWTNLCRYSLLALAMVVLATTETVASWVPWVALAAMALMVVAVLLLVLALHREAFAQRLGAIIGWALRPVMKLLHKPAIDDMDERVDSFRKLIAETAGNVWGSLTATMLLSQLTAFVILGVALRMQGIDEATVSWSRIIVAWGGMSLASLIVPTPGGLGVAEAALAAILSPAVPDSQTANMVSAIVLFRGATWFLPIPIGSVSYLFWRKTTRWRRTAEDRYGAPDPDAGTGPGAPSGVVPATGA